RQVGCARDAHAVRPAEAGPVLSGACAHAEENGHHQHSSCTARERHSVNLNHEGHEGHEDHGGHGDHVRSLSMSLPEAIATALASWLALVAAIAYGLDALGFPLAPTVIGLAASGAV